VTRRARCTPHVRWTAALALLALLLPALAGAQATATLTRYPALHGDAIVFEAHGNLWRVSRSGGRAERLTSEPGFDLMPRFSPDGRWIAFTGGYQGNVDVYVIPATGGVARRLTFHSDAEDDSPLRFGPDNMVVTWTPDSRRIVFLSRREAFNSWFGRLFSVPVEGGYPEALPLDKGGLLSYGPDGHRVAYERIFTNFRTWKRYDGGLAQDIWLYDLHSHALERLTDWKGLDNDPMWYGNTIYFVSDRDEHRRANLWALDLATRTVREVTHFTDFDVDWPSLGDSGIVFQQGGALYVLDLPSETLHKVAVEVPDDGTRTGPRFVDGARAIKNVDSAGDINFDVAPNGKRALFEARGDVFTVPEKYGSTRNLTQSPAANEEHPSWSPDGRWIAYVSDAGGESQIAIRPSGGGDERVLTHFASGYFYRPSWSPDSKMLAFSDNDHRLWIVGLHGDAPLQVDHDPFQEIHDARWSPDAHWLAYSKVGSNQLRSLWLYHLDNHRASTLGDGTENDRAPAFDPQGRYLYFLSARHENPTFSEVEFNVASIKTAGIYVLPLRKSAASPFAPRSDEAVAGTDDEASEKSTKAAAHKGGGDGGGADSTWQAGAIAPMHIDLDGLMARAVPVPIPGGNYDALAVTRQRLYYLSAEPNGISGPLPGVPTALHVFDMKAREDKVLIDNLDGYVLSADGQHVLYRKDHDFFVVPAVADADSKPDSDTRKALDLGHMRWRTDPRQEWSEMYAQAWRLLRDFFYSKRMNGVDWTALRSHYQQLLPLLGSREDLNYVIGELVGELGSSHTYVGGGDFADPTEHAGTGMLGVDYSVDVTSGRYRLQHVYRGDNSREEYRSPLSEPGLDVRDGDFLLGIDGRPLRVPDNPDERLLLTSDTTVQLRVARSANGAGAREIKVVPVKSELSLRLRDWIEHNRQTVDQASHGTIGYIYLSDMESLGMEQFIRQFYPQLRKQGLIIDDRYNGGGFIDQILLERLRRMLIGMDTNRQRAPATEPAEVFGGYKACLINEYSASDGDIFPYYFRRYGLGPLIGKRTWGGVRGIRGDWSLLDGGYITIPEDSLYGLDSQWVIENVGVAPDVEVDDTPGELLAGRDAQLLKAVELLGTRIREQPPRIPVPPPELPAYPPAGP
jgi:tricorn protease